MSVSKIDRETAEMEFDDWCESWEIDSETSDMKEDEKNDFNTQKNKIVKAIMKGRLIVNDEKNIEYYFAHPELARNIQSVIIKRPNGQALMSMDKYAEKESVHKMYSIISGMTEKEVSFFGNIDGIDMKVFQAVAVLFLAS